MGFQVRALGTLNIHSEGYMVRTLTARKKLSKVANNQHCIHSFVIQNGIGAQNHGILLRIRTIWLRRQKNLARNLERGHDRFNILGIKFQNTVQNRNFIITKGFLACSMKLEKRLQFRLLIGMLFVRPKNQVKKFRNRPSNRSYVRWIH